MVYLIQSCNFLKIGYTNDIVKRMKQYNTHNPGYSLLSIIEGDIEVEKRLHAKFSKLRYKNEWFCYNDAILNEFKTSGKVSDDEFFYMFTCGSSILYKITSALTIKLVIKLCCSLKNNSNILDMSSTSTKMLGAELGFSDNQLIKALKLLEDLNIIYRKNENIKLNPAMFWRGDIKSRNYTIMDDIEELMVNNKLEE